MEKLPARDGARSALDRRASGQLKPSPVGRVMLAYRLSFRIKCKSMRGIEINLSENRRFDLWYQKPAGAQLTKKAPTKATTPAISARGDNELFE